MRILFPQKAQMIKRVCLPLARIPLAISMIHAPKFYKEENNLIVICSVKALKCSAYYFVIWQKGGVHL